MGVVSGCFVLAVTYLSCNINPLSFGSYPNVQFITFPSSGIVPRIITYRYEDWGDLKFVNTGRNVYSCRKGQCLLNPENTGEIDITSSTPSVMFNPKLTSFQTSGHSIQSTLRNEPLDIFSSTTSIKFPTTQTVLDVNSLQSTMNSDEFISPSMGMTDEQINPGNMNKSYLVSHLSKYLQGRIQKLGKTVISKVLNQTKKELKATFKKEFEKIEDIFIGLSSTIISIPVFGGVIIIGVKMYKKRHRNLNIPEHLYLPLHQPGVVGHLPQYNLDSETDEDLDVFDLSRDRSRRKEPLSPSAPQKTPTPKKDERETVVKQRIVPEDLPMTSNPPKDESKQMHKGSRSDEASSSSSQNPYNLRSREQKDKRKEVESTVL